MRHAEFWLGVVGLVVLALSAGGVVSNPQVVVVAAACVGIPAVLGVHADRAFARRLDHEQPVAVQAAVHRYVTDPNAEVADLERDLDCAFRANTRAPHGTLTEPVIGGVRPVVAESNSAIVYIPDPEE